MEQLDDTAVCDSCVYSCMIGTADCVSCIKQLLGATVCDSCNLQLHH